MKDKFILAVVELLKVKSIITIVMILTACYLALTDKVDIAVFVGMVTSVITYYFTKKEDK